MQLTDKRVIVSAAVGSVILLAAATVGGKDSGPDVFVSALGALGQVWIAVMLWHLAREQFAFTKLSFERGERATNYDRRSTVLTDWSAASTAIGYTDLNEGNVQALRRLLNPIGNLFGVHEKDLGKGACDAASAARERARELKKVGSPLKDDPDYRRLIDDYKAKQKATYEALKARLAVTGD